MPAASRTTRLTHSAGLALSEIASARLSDCVTALSIIFSLSKYRLHFAYERHSLQFSYKLSELTWPQDRKPEPNHRGRSCTMPQSIEQLLQESKELIARSRELRARSQQAATQFADLTKRSYGLSDDARKNMRQFDDSRREKLFSK